jgi:hypothetical protein
MLEYYEDIYSARVSFTSSDSTIFTWNDPPVMSSGSVSPSSGTTDDNFTYQVNFQDNEGETPGYVRVNVDGTSHDMALVSGSYASGATYSYITNSLDNGSHTYYFEALDGSGTAARYPTSDTFSGPDVSASVPEVTTPEVSTPPLDVNLIIIAAAAVIALVVVVVAALFLRRR